MTEEEWAARQKQRSGNTSGKTSPKPKPLAVRWAVPAMAPHAEKGINCRYCGKPGHWAMECRKKKKG
jgi:hypothetical protein